MAIEKMALVSIEGTLKKVNRTLMKCCESECFHIIPFIHTDTNANNIINTHNSKNNTIFKTLKDHNTFTPIVKRAIHLADGLGIKLKYSNYEDVKYSVSVDFADYFKEIEDEYSSLYTKHEEVQTSLQQHQHVLFELERLAGLSSNFEEIFAMKYIKVRFGRLPADNYAKLKYFDDKLFSFLPYETKDDYVWGVYFTPNAESVVVDDIFKSLFYERVRMPDYLTGTADESKARIMQAIEEETLSLDLINAEIKKLADKVSESFIQVYCKLKALNDSYEVRSNVSVINNRFYLSGYIPEKQIVQFKTLIEETETVTAQIMPHDSDPINGPPVKLNNNRLFRPFEMFVNMYGLPAYNGIDPTPFVAVTYMLIYGIMFGDFGQGLLISLIGLFLDKRKKVKLGAIVTRIGISSAVFGVLYGSVFGNEEIIEPFFKFKPVYKMMGFDTAPKDIFEVSAFLLIGALALGVSLIIITMVINIITCIKARDYKNGLFSSNGVIGMVLYMSVIFGAVCEIALGISAFSTLYVFFLIIVPLLCLFFKEPLSEIFKSIEKKSHGNRINKDLALIQLIKMYSKNDTGLNIIGYNLEQLSKCKYIKSCYGTLSYESYRKLELLEDKKFFFFPFESDSENITGTYLATEADFPSVDKLFLTLGFLKKKTGNILNKAGKQDIIKSNETKEAKKFSVGNFIIEGAIDLFETALTYLTNSMSFFRIAGFILSHAGLMLVVNILAESAGEVGSIGWIAVQIIGNLFVIGLEGFLVGIQVLRLEFYEMFSRFYVSSGKKFKPIVMDLELENN